MGDALHGGSLHRADGASSNALGGCGFVQAAESDDTHAELFHTFSTPLARRAATARMAQIYPSPYHGQAPRLARAKGWLRNM